MSRPIVTSGSLHRPLCRTVHLQGVRARRTATCRLVVSGRRRRRRRPLQCPGVFGFRTSGDAGSRNLAWLVCWTAGVVAGTRISALWKNRGSCRVAPCRALVLRCSNFFFGRLGRDEMLDSGRRNHPLTKGGQ